MSRIKLVLTNSQHGSKHTLYPRLVRNEYRTHDLYISKSQYYKARQSLCHYRTCSCGKTMGFSVNPSQDGKGFNILNIDKRWNSIEPNEW